MRCNATPKSTSPSSASFGSRPSEVPARAASRGIRHSPEHPPATIGRAAEPCLAVETLRRLVPGSSHARLPLVVKGFVGRWSERPSEAVTQTARILVGPVHRRGAQAPPDHHEHRSDGTRVARNGEGTSCERVTGAEDRFLASIALNQTTMLAAADELQAATTDATAWLTANPCPDPNLTGHVALLLDAYAEVVLTAQRAATEPWADTKLAMVRLGRLLGLIDFHSQALDEWQHRRRTPVAGLWQPDHASHRSAAPAATIQVAAGAASDHSPTYPRTTRCRGSMTGPSGHLCHCPASPAIPPGTGHAVTNRTASNEEVLHRTTQGCTATSSTTGGSATPPAAVISTRSE